MARHSATQPSQASEERQPAAEGHLDSVVDHWFVETFHNRAIDPDETNRLTAAKDRLKALLRGVKE